MRNELPQGRKSDLESVDPDRRKALKAIGQFAVYVSPAMTVLLKGDPADANHAGNSPPGHGTGQGRCKNKPWLSIC